MEFGLGELREGVRSGIYQKVSERKAMRAMEQGATLSSAFVVWQGEGADRKGRFVVSLGRMSKRWDRGSVGMEGLADFGASMLKDDHFVSMDVEKGYRCLRLHPAMRDWFIFHYGGVYYQYVALPFGWGRSPLWFCALMEPFTQKLREWGYRVLSYIDDFLIAPAPHGVVSTQRDCVEASTRIDRLLKNLGIRRHATKGHWGEGTRRLEHLGVIVDSRTLQFEVSPTKVKKVKSMSAALLQQSVVGRRYVSDVKLRSFCGVCFALSPAMPWARYYTRSLYDVFSRGKRDSRGRIRLSHQAVRDLRFWRGLARCEETRRAIHPRPPDASLHTDAADVGYGETLHLEDMREGAPGMYVDQQIWSWRERASAITHRELKAVRLTLQRKLGQRLAPATVQHVLVHGDNQSAVHVLNSLVSASPAIMSELRHLKRVMDALGIKLSANWLPSVMNRYADGLSRRLPRRDAQILPRLRRSVAAGMRAPRDVFPYRPLGEHPFVSRRLVLEKLQRDWGLDDTLVLCPPPDLITAVLRKLQQTKSPALLLIPAWPRQAWYAAAIGMADHWERLECRGRRSGRPRTV